MSEKSNRQVALELAMAYTQGTYDADGKYSPPVIPDQMRTAELFLAFLEDDEVS